MRLILRLSSSAVALLRLVVGPRKTLCLNAHKRGAPTPEGVGRATRCTPSTTFMGVGLVSATILPRKRLRSYPWPTTTLGCDPVTVAPDRDHTT